MKISKLKVFYFLLIMFLLSTFFTHPAAAIWAGHPSNVRRTLESCDTALIGQVTGAYLLLDVNPEDDTQQEDHLNFIDKINSHIKKKYFVEKNTLYLFLEIKVEKIFKNLDKDILVKNNLKPLYKGQTIYILYIGLTLGEGFFLPELNEKIWCFTKCKKENSINTLKKHFNFAKMNNILNGNTSDFQEGVKLHFPVSFYFTAEDISAIYGYNDESREQAFDIYLKINKIKDKVEKIKAWRDALEKYGETNHYIQYTAQQELMRLDPPPKRKGSVIFIKNN